MAFAALLLGMLMASLDTNVVVAALPSLGPSLGQPDAVAGVTAAYLLVVAVATPLHGSLGDCWGRRVMFVVSVLVFAAGSFACALAPSMPALIGFRALQGLGGSGLIVAAVSAMAELFDREQMIRRQGWLTAMFAVSSIGGAPLGGFLAAGPGWQWIFLVNPPICLVALGLGANSVPARRAATPAAKHRGFDVLGATLVAVGGASIVGLGSSETLARSPLWAPMLVVVALMAMVLLVKVERRVAAPLIPPRLFADPGLSRSVAATLASGVALFGSFTFVPLAITAGARVDPSTLGLLLLPASVGQLAASSGFVVLTRRWPAITAWGRVGLLMGVVGMLSIAAVPMLGPGVVRTTVTLLGLALAGAALGLSMQAYTLVAQARAPIEIVGATMATVTFTRQIGGSLGIAVFGWLALLLGESGGLTTVFVLAAAVLLTGVVLAPRSYHDQPRAAAASAASRGGA